MSSTLDPLSEITSSAASTELTSLPTQTMEKAAVSRRKPLPLAVIYSLWGLGVLAVAVGLWLLLVPSTGSGERPRNDQRPSLVSELGPERDFEWNEEQLASQENWKKSLAWLNRTPVTLTPVKQAAAVDPWRDERWEVEFRTGHTLESYTRELDALGIEPGLIDSSGVITYISDITNATPKTRTGQLDDEKRYYMFWRIGSLKGADAKVFEAAKLSTAKKLVAHFYSAEVTQEMVARELAFAGGRPLSDVRKTVFAVKPTASSFAMNVIRQEYQDGSVQDAAAEAPISDKIKLKDKAAVLPGSEEPPSPAEPESPE